MKKRLIFGLIVLLLICVVPVGALQDVDDVFNVLCAPTAILPKHRVLWFSVRQHHPAYRAILPR